MLVVMPVADIARNSGPSYESWDVCHARKREGMGLDVVASAREGTQFSPNSKKKVKPVSS